ncbi:MAG: SGNH/GDSL hydrolase family protein [Cellulomonadaceae bacterium]|jgi:lysophospholipase L1-like esterase|nr:SGNH/GDSL hydrolase family protein [Cellulomonadaceae bacterium]
MGFGLEAGVGGISEGSIGVGAPRWGSYIAIGDSVTEGLCDPYPSADTSQVNSEISRESDQNPNPQGANSGISDRYRGWADRLAEILSARRLAAGLPALEYANLAIRGRLLGPIIEEQLPAAIEQKPALISLLGGGNDVLRPKADIDALATKLETAVEQIHAAGIDVLLGTGFKAGGRLRFTRGRTGPLNATIWSIARRHGAYVMDNWGVKSLYDYQMFADDLIHPNSTGHARMANAALVGLGLEPTEPNWDVMLPPKPAAPIVPESRVPAALQPRFESLRADARWARDFAGPWVERRVTGKSTGDGLEPKVPTLRPWYPVGNT